MTHLPFIAASYALGLLVPGWFAVAAFLRMRTAQRRLAMVDPRLRPGDRQGRTQQAGFA